MFTLPCRMICRRKSDHDKSSDVEKTKKSMNPLIGQLHIHVAVQNDLPNEGKDMIMNAPKIDPSKEWT